MDIIDRRPNPHGKNLENRRRVLARGLVAYSSSQLPRMLGRKTSELKADLGEGYDGVVVHADDWVRLAPPRR